MIIMLFVISFIIFVALNNTGVDPVTFRLSVDDYNAEEVEQMRDSMGLNDPLVIRYFRWIGNIITGNFGISVVKGYSIKDHVIARWPASLELAIIALVVSTFVGIGIGILSAYWQNSPIDYFGRAFAVLGNSMPSYFFGLILIVFFSLKLHWLPSGGRIPVEGSRVPNLILPVLAMTIPMCGNLMRYTRNTMLDVANQEYVKTARSKGVPEWKIYIKHIFRNSMRPVVTVLLFRLGILVGGSVAIETIFDWPGVGKVLTAAITTSDYDVVMLSALLTAFLMLVISLLVDVFTAILDPRVRLEG